MNLRTASTKSPALKSRRRAARPKPWVITMYGQKGGGGKTTLATNLVAEAMRRGYRVLLVDLDPQGTATDWHETMATEHASNERRPAPPPLVSALNKVPDLAEYDLVVIDVPAKLDDQQGGALRAADVALIPCSPSRADTRALGRGLALIRQAQADRPALKAYVVITRCKSAASARRLREGVGSALEVLRSEIWDRLVYQDAYGAGQGVTTYEPSGRAADEVLALFQELERLP